MANRVDNGRTNRAHLGVEFRYSEQKNAWLLEHRKVSFHDVIDSIADFGILADFEHPDQEKYSGQRIMVVRIDDYPHCVPYSLDHETVNMKTVYPSRKFRHLVEGGQTDE